ncbi:hypothetical protein Moror_4894 [Moniliophthora roreri MCA 2997]|uniref:Uncharacterized protein n=2 Tax=Moniliophthora roreri TaxID=221103 RepID=V2WPH6_MONRO|nr:hypothetical protein Moror_4894 [Moniliophthora roreri MCA 2997]KAI3619409.1 hypothetical protein WG66_012653 [Moniliophthora roreri]
MDEKSHPVSYPPEVYDEMGSPTSSRSDTIEEANGSRRFRLNRPQSRLFRRSDKGRESLAPTQSNTPSHHSSRRSVSALLVLTTERLNNATARATNLETQQDELVKRFGTLLKEKTDLERELDATHESLRLYKAQLDVARREIERADGLVHEIDRRRTKAESESARLRSQVRTLEAERIIRKGWEEGWELGFKEGLERAQVERGMFSRFNLRRRRHRSRDDRSDYGDDYTDGGRDDDTTNAGSTTSSSNRPRSNSTRSRRSNYTPDAGELAPPLPIPTVTTPAPLNIPSTQPQQPQRPPSAAEGKQRERAASMSYRYNDIGSSGGTQQDIPRRPQSRTIRRNTAPSVARAPSPVSRQNSQGPPEVIQPIPMYDAPPSPSATSHRSRSTAPPPDGFIPFRDENEFISLPPPHGMSVPVPAAGPAASNGHDLSASAPPSGGYEAPSGFLATPQNRAMSEVSRASTRISQLDIISPPRASGLLGLRVVNADRPGGNGRTSRNQKGPRNSRPNTPGATPATRVEQWRNEIIGDVDRPDRQTTPATAREPSASTSVSPPATSPTRDAFRVRTPRVSIGPRRPREIVLPAPLAAPPLPPQQREASSNVQRLEQVAGRSNTPIRSPTPSHGFSAPQPPYQQPVASSLRPEPPPIPPSDNLEPNRPRTPRSLGAWLRSRFQRSHSTPPNIDVESPSNTATSGSGSTRVDPVLLTPEDANRPIPLPNDVVSEATRGIERWNQSTPVPQTPITIQLPDDDLPLGFVAMTPVVPLQDRNQLGRSPRQENVISPISSRPGSPGSFSPIQPLDSSPSPPSRPATASGLTRPPLSTMPVGDGVATRALSGPPVDRVAELTSPRARTLSLDGHHGWTSPTSSFMRPLESIFSDDD